MKFLFRLLHRSLLTVIYRSTYDGVNVITVGDRGYIYYSSNRGTTWSRGTSGTVSTVYCVTHSSKLVAMVGGLNSFVARTEDGGATWRNMTIFSSSTVSVRFHAISMVSDSVAYVSADNGEIYRTWNSGNTWTRIASFGKTLYSIAIYDTIKGVAGAISQSGFYTSVAGMF